MNEFTCSYESCEGKALTRGMCDPHYRRTLKGRPMDAPIKHRIREAAPADGKCTTPGCDRKHASKGLCQAHYMRLLRGKTVAGGLRATPGAAKPQCSVIHCQRAADSTLNGAVCSAHRMLWARSGRYHPVINRPFAMTRCGVAGCRKKYFSSGMCTGHHTRAYKYGLSVLQLDLLLSTHSACDICAKPITPATAHIDHDHACCPDQASCGMCVRGVLCSGCNVGLGAFRDSVQALSAAALYLAA